MKARWRLLRTPPTCTGRYDYCQALLKKVGHHRGDDVDEAVDVIKAFEAGRFPAGRQVAVMGGSRGSAIVFADAAEQSGLRLARLYGETQRRIARVIPEIGAVHNPIDFTAGYTPVHDEEKRSTCSNRGARGYGGARGLL